MNEEIDLVFVSAMIGRAIEDLVFRQIEEVERENALTDIGTKALEEMRSPVDFEGNPKDPMNYGRIDADIKVLANLKESIDKQLGLI